MLVVYSTRADFLATATAYIACPRSRGLWSRPQPVVVHRMVVGEDFTLFKRQKRRVYAGVLTQTGMRHITIDANDDAFTSVSTFVHWGYTEDKRAYMSTSTSATIKPVRVGKVRIFL